MQKIVKFIGKLINYSTRVYNMTISFKVSQLHLSTTSGTKQVHHDRVHLSGKRSYETSSFNLPLIMKIGEDVYTLVSSPSQSPFFIFS